MGGSKPTPSSVVAREPPKRRRVFFLYFVYGPPWAWSDPCSLWPLEALVGFQASYSERLAFGPDNGGVILGLNPGLRVYFPNLSVVISK